MHHRRQRYSTTRRGEEIVCLVVQGYANKEMAEVCHVSEQTVKDHWKHVYQKLGIHQRTALFARLLGIGSPIESNGNLPPVNKRSHQPRASARGRLLGVCAGTAGRYL